MNAHRLTTLKERIAREAAILLYTSQEKEYKQAKLRAAQILGVKILPTNAQVANELDSIAEETEGTTRRERLLQMRREALQIMKTLAEFHPKLIGSVWRGTAHKNSDIDIATFASDPATVLAKLQKADVEVSKTEWQSSPKKTLGDKSFHIHASLHSGNEVEVVVRSMEGINKTEKCEIYGDAATGLNITQLERVLAENPFQKFVP